MSLGCTVVVILTLLLPGLATAAGPQLVAQPRGSEETKTLASKIGIRFVSGTMSNSGEGGGSVTSGSGMLLNYHYYVTPALAIGAGFGADFDFGGGAVNFWSYQVSGRWYPWGGGTRVTTQFSNRTSELVTKTAFYVGPEFVNTNYYLGSNTRDAGVPTLNGSFFNVNAVGGFDYRMSREFELNAEGSAGVLTFAASDDRVKIRAYALRVGVSFLW